jgi:hypothetical protein
MSRGRPSSVYGQSCRRSSPADQPAPTDDRLPAITDAASRLGVSEEWPRRHADRLTGRRIREDEGNGAVVYRAEPIRSGYVLIPRARLANVISLELLGRGEFPRRMDVGDFPLDEPARNVQEGTAR